MTDAKEHESNGRLLRYASMVARMNPTCELRDRHVSTSLRRAEGPLSWVREPRPLPGVDSDLDAYLLLLSDANWSRSRCGRLAVTSPGSVWLVPPDWAPVLRRVLVPIDFSERSVECLRLAANLMRPFPSAKCVALHVYPDETRFADEASDRGRRRELGERFDAMVEQVDARGVAIEPQFVAGHRIDGEIARAADRHAADLVIMASRGRSRAAALVRPSVVQFAIRRSRASFLVLKSSDEPLGFWRALRERLCSPDGLQFS